MVSWAEHGLPLLFAGGLWFVATGAVLALDSRGRSGFARSLALTGGLACAALVAVVATLGDASAFAAYVAFAAALTIWGWHELSFLTGAVTGPRREPLPAGAQGWTRFRLSAATLIHHEIALAATVVLLAVLSWGAPNPIAAQTFALLFVMRLSSKLNIFAGVPHFDTAMLPPHLAYLGSYFRRAAVGLPMLLSLAALIVGAILLGDRAVAASDGAAVGVSLIFALVALGLLEHLFLILPVRDAALWRWAKRHKNAESTYRITGVTE